jgi:hypothetical protein
LAICVLAGCGAATFESRTPGHATAVAACRAIAGEGWQLAVETDRADTSALALVSGASIDACLTTRTDGDFGTTSLGGGAYPAPSPIGLSYLTSQKAGEQLILVGRIPAGAAKVRLTLADGPSQEASLGDGLWLAWVSTTSKPILIEAVDASGATIERIGDPNGVQPDG